MLSVAGDLSPCVWGENIVILRDLSKKHKLTQQAPHRCGVQSFDTAGVGKFFLSKLAPTTTRSRSTSGAEVEPLDGSDSKSGLNRSLDSVSFSFSSCSAVGDGASAYPCSLAISADSSVKSTISSNCISFVHKWLPSWSCEGSSSCFAFMAGSAFKKFKYRAEGTPEPQDLCNMQGITHSQETINSTEGTQEPQNDCESPKQAFLEPQVEANCMCDKVFGQQARGRSMMRRCHRVRTSPPTGSPVDDVDQVPRRHGHKKDAAANARRRSASTWAGDSSLFRRVLCATRRAIVEARVVSKRRILGTRGLSVFRRQVHRHGRVAHMRAALFCSYASSQSSGDLAGSEGMVFPEVFTGVLEGSEGNFVPKEKAVLNLMGGGRADGSEAVDGRNGLLNALRDALAKFPAPAPGPQGSRPGNQKGSKAKPCLHAALARLVAKPPAGDVFLKRLQKLVKGAEAGHYLLDSPSAGSVAGTQNTPIVSKESPAAEAPKDTPKKAKSILKKNSSKPFTELAVGSNPLLDYALRDEDWKGLAIMKQASVLSKLQRGEAPGPQPVAAILSEEAAEEAAALWK